MQADTPLVNIEVHTSSSSVQDEASNDEDEHLLLHESSGPPRRLREASRYRSGDTLQGDAAAAFRGAWLKLQSQKSLAPTVDKAAANVKPDGDTKKRYLQRMLILNSANSFIRLNVRLNYHTCTDTGHDK